MRDELGHIKATYGIEYAALFDADGALVATAVGRAEHRGPGRCARASCRDLLEATAGQG